jgi:hypothetical protein
MFSVQQKRHIADSVQAILLATHHPELPKDREIEFTLAIAGATSASWAHILNNGAVTHPGVNLHNEMMATFPTMTTAPIDDDEAKRTIAAMNDLLIGIRFAMDQAGHFDGKVDWSHMIEAIDQVTTAPLEPVVPTGFVAVDAAKFEALLADREQYRSALGDLLTVIEEWKAKSPLYGAKG